jgi:hypothetical protein
VKNTGSDTPAVAITRQRWSMSGLRRHGSITQQPADGGGIDVVGASDISLRLLAHRSLDKDAPIPRRSSGPAASCHMLSSVDCITTTTESEFLVHTAGLFGDLRLSTLICWRRTKISGSRRTLDWNSPMSVDRRATASPDSHRFASYMEFPTGTRKRANKPSRTTGKRNVQH